MTNTEIIQAIKAEVERLYGENHNHADRWDMGYDAACEKILDFLDSLESEKPVPNDLEEAADKYAEKLTSEPYLQVVHKTDFIAGAEWDREQMMKEAVEGRVFMSFVPGHNQMVMADVDLPTNTNVRVIVLPKEEEKTTTKSSEDTEFWPLHRP